MCEHGWIGVTDNDYIHSSPVTPPADSDVVRITLAFEIHDFPSFAFPIQDANGHLDRLRFAESKEPNLKQRCGIGGANGEGMMLSSAQSLFLFVLRQCMDR